MRRLLSLVPLPGATLPSLASIGTIAWLVGWHRRHWSTRKAPRLPGWGKAASLRVAHVVKKDPENVESDDDRQQVGGKSHVATDEKILRLERV